MEGHLRKIESKKLKIITKTIPYMTADGVGDYLILIVVQLNLKDGIPQNLLTPLI